MPGQERHLSRGKGETRSTPEQKEQERERERERCQRKGGETGEMRWLEGCLSRGRNEELPEQDCREGIEGTNPKGPVASGGTHNRTVE